MNSIIGDSVTFALPLFIIAIGGIYCEGSGIVNLASEGFLGMGAFFGGFAFALFAQFLGMSSVANAYLSLLFALCGGAIFSMIYALLSIKFKANQVVSGVVVNMLSTALSAFLASQLNLSIFGQASNKFLLAVFPRFTVKWLVNIPILGAFFDDTYVFVYIILFVAIIMTYVLYKTPFGMNLRACGDNPQAVATTGRDVNSIRFKAIVINGALAGFGGMCFAYSISTNFSSSIYAGYGYLAIAAYIFGNWRIKQTLYACLIFGFSRSIGYVLIQHLGLPSTYSDLVLTLPYIMTLVLLLFFSKSNISPKALGEPYEKSKR
ncbi:MAG: ABC transporter permease [Sphaerochaetaceae bacterium]